MKFLAYFLILSVSVFFGQTLAQCPNAPQRPSCSGPPHSGFSGIRCISGTRWYYNVGTRTCISFFYNGCGGNTNRYCSLGACQRSCIRSG